MVLLKTKYYILFIIRKLICMDMKMGKVYRYCRQSMKMQGRFQKVWPPSMTDIGGGILIGMGFMSLNLNMELIMSGECKLLILL